MYINPTGKPVSKPVAREKKPHAKIKSRSKTGAKEDMEYNKRVKEWKKGKICAVCKTDKCEDNHHMKGRGGEMLMNEDFWLPVCRWCHTCLTDNPSFAYEHGYSFKKFR